MANMSLKKNPMPTQSPEEFLEETERKVSALETGEGVVALVDILGGTPNNTLFRLSKKYNIRIVTGVNLSMVMYCVLERYDGMTSDELIEALLQTGKSEIAEFGKN